MILRMIVGSLDAASSIFCKLRFANVESSGRLFPKIIPNPQERLERKIAKEGLEKQETSKWPQDVEEILEMSKTFPLCESKENIDMAKKPDSTWQGVVLRK